MHRANGREVIVGISVVVGIRIVFVDVSVDSCLLPHEELRLLSEEGVDLIERLAPVSVGRRVLTVSDADDGKRIIGHKPVVVHRDLLAIFEAERLMVPGLSVLFDEQVQEFGLTDLQLVLRIHMEITAQDTQVVSDEVDVRIVQNVKSSWQISDAGDKVETAVVLLHIDVHIEHVLDGVGDFHLVESVLPTDVDLLHTGPEEGDRDDNGDDAETAAEESLALPADLQLLLEIVLVSVLGVVGFVAGYRLRLAVRVAAFELM